MAYVLATLSGDSRTVPQLVFSHLTRTDGDTIRVALYVLETSVTDPATIAHDLRLKSVESAKRCLQYWAGAGLLQQEKGAASFKTEDQKASEIDLTAIDDPFVSVISTESQQAFGKGLSRSELQRLVALYLNEGWHPDVILLCCAHMAGLGKRSVAAVVRELARWRNAGVETGEDAERFLKQEDRRAAWCAEIEKLFGQAPGSLTAWERRAVARWFEEWHMDTAMADEALLHAEQHRTVRYVDGILRSWHAQGLNNVQAVRGKGTLSGSNITTTARTPMPNKTGPDLFHQNWNAVFDEED